VYWLLKGIDSCPFIAGAKDNLPTEDLCFMLKSLDYSKNIFIEKLVDTSEVTQKLFDKSSGG